MCCLGRLRPMFGVICGRRLPRTIVRTRIVVPFLAPRSILTLTCVGVCCTLVVVWLILCLFGMGIYRFREFVLMYLLCRLLLTCRSWMGWYLNVTRGGRRLYLRLVWALLSTFRSGGIGSMVCVIGLWLLGNWRRLAMFGYSMFLLCDGVVLGGYY